MGLSTMPRLRLAIVIGSFNGTTGLGGHFYSALSIARGLATQHEVLLINIGDYPARALARSDSAFEYIHVSPRLLFIDRSELRRRLVEFCTDIVVAFDVISGQFVRPICLAQRFGFIQIKAGGPIPLSYFPRNVHQVHFGAEDVPWAQGRCAQNDRRIEWIPNRVSPGFYDMEPADELPRAIVIEADEIVILRIRTTEAHSLELSIWQSFSDETVTRPARS